MGNGIYLILFPIWPNVTQGVQYISSIYMIGDAPYSTAKEFICTIN